MPDAVRKMQTSRNPYGISEGLDG